MEFGNYVRRPSWSIEVDDAIAAGGAGPQGPPGPPGADGAQGPQGIQGPAGSDGAQGPQGIQGIPGPAGADGAQGPQGDTGPAGADGAQGPAGADGADSTVPGPQGDPGADGAQGPQGDQGIQGIQGIQGVQGEPGPPGDVSGAWPVGTVFISVVSTNPATLLGLGTWVAFATGRVLVGIDAGQTEFDVVEETGGAKTHTLTAAEMPAHTHPENVPSSASGGAEKIALDTNASGSTDAGVATGSAGGGGAHNNLQPYIVVYMWKRTA